MSSNIDFQKNTYVSLHSEKDFSIFDVSTSDKVLVANSKHGKLELKVNHDFTGEISLSSKSNWTINVFPISDPTDPIPVEIPEEYKNPNDMMSNIRAYLDQLVRERYGKDSKEYDTFDEFIDDYEEDAEPRSGYEVDENAQNEPIQEEKPKEEVPLGDEEKGKDEAPEDAP